MEDDLIDWTRDILADILTISPDTIDDAILFNIIAYDDPEELIEFISAFALDAQGQDAYHGRCSIISFVNDLFQRKTANQSQSATREQQYVDLANNNSCHTSLLQSSQGAKTADAINSSLFVVPKATGVHSYSNAVRGVNPIKQTVAPTECLNSFPGLVPTSVRPKEDYGVQKKKNASKLVGSFGRVTCEDREEGDGLTPGAASDASGSAKGRKIFKQQRKGNQLLVYSNTSKQPGVRQSNAAPFRIICRCMATEHELLNNCLTCGKIVCAQEGAGPCLWCGNLVVAKYKSIEKCEKTYGLKSLDSKDSQSLQQARAHKDKLIAYDRDSVQRTKVFNDSADWYSESHNLWLSEKQRTEALEMHRLQTEALDKRNVKYTLDFSERQVYEAQPFYYALDDDLADGYPIGSDEKSDFAQKKTINVQKCGQSATQNLDEMKISAHPNLKGAALDVYDALRLGSTSTKKQLQKNGEQQSSYLQIVAPPKQPVVYTERYIASTYNFSSVKAAFVPIKEDLDIQDVTAADTSPLLQPLKLVQQETSPWKNDMDEGVCLSMHQPWASMVISGFKRIEGRDWKTDYCGRLWIHSAKLEPLQSDIDSVLTTYDTLYGTNRPVLPHCFPTGCLLGCVDIIDCIPQDEYQVYCGSQTDRYYEVNPSGFLFVLSRPRRLVIPIPMNGKHKIWRLDNTLFRNYQRALVPVLWPALEPRAASQPSDNSQDEVARTIDKSIQNIKLHNDIQYRSYDSYPIGFDIHPNCSVGDSSTHQHIVNPLDILSGFPLNATQRSSNIDKNRVRILQPGFVVIQSFLTEAEQICLVETIQPLGVRVNGFYVPSAEKEFVSSHARVLCCGIHWNENMRCYDFDERSNVDGQAIPTLPIGFDELYNRIIKIVNEVLKRYKMTTLPVNDYGADTAIIHFFESGGRLPMQQATGESLRSRQAGYPMLLINIGDTFELLYSNEAISASHDAMNIMESRTRIQSGDIVLIGGPSRYMHLGMGRISPNTAPLFLRNMLRNGRLSISLRVY